MLKNNEGVVFVHIPKCAGMSIGKVLSDNLPVKNLIIPWNKVDESINKIDIPLDKGFLCKAHLNYNHILKLREQYGQVIQYKVITSIRHPIRRAVSEYFYCRSDMHPNSDLFVERYPTFESWVYNALEENPIALTLTGSNTDFITTLQTIRQTYDAVMVIEKHQSVKKVLSSLLDKKVVYLPKLNVNESDEYSVFYDSMSPKVKRYMRELFDIDLALHSFFRLLN